MGRYHATVADKGFAVKVEHSLGFACMTYVSCIMPPKRLQGIASFARPGDPGNMAFWSWQNPTFKLETNIGAIDASAAANGKQQGLLRTTGWLAR